VLSEGKDWGGGLTTMSKSKPEKKEDSEIGIGTKESHMEMRKKKK